MIPKFRAWHKKEKRMIHIKKPIIITFLDYEKGLRWRINKDDEFGGCIMWEEDGILMQSTGLKDKNGKEIFEGDILNDKLWAKSAGFDEVNVEVKFNKPHGTWEGLHKEGLVFSPSTFKRLEVIGNIHENPKMLNPPSNKEKI